MGPRESQRMNRRTAMKTVAGSVILGGVVSGQASADGHIDTTVSINNIGANAWEVTNLNGTSVIADTGVSNPEIKFTSTEVRYRFENNGYPNHPLAFRDSSGNTLLSQSTTGTFNNDSAVNWVDNENSVAFTLTSDLASQMSEYRCTVHSSMVGNASVDTQAVDYTPDMGSVSFTSPADGATKTTPVSFDMTAENFTIESASNGVRDGAGHLHILVDQQALEPGEVIPNNESNGYYHYGDGSTTAEINLKPGTHTVRVQAGDAKHRAYNLTDSIEVTAELPDDAPPSVIGDNAPTDTDGDGKYEDVNGDGKFDIVDVQATFENRESSVVQNNQKAFDYNDDGEFTIVDVNRLFQDSQ